MAAVVVIGPLTAGIISYINILGIYSLIYHIKCQAIIWKFQLLINSMIESNACMNSDMVLVDSDLNSGRHFHLLSVWNMCNM